MLKNAQKFNWAGLQPVATEWLGPKHRAPLLCIQFDRFISTNVLIKIYQPV